MPRETCEEVFSGVGAVDNNVSIVSENVSGTCAFVAETAAVDCGAFRADRMCVHVGKQVVTQGKALLIEVFLVTWNEPLLA